MKRNNGGITILEQPKGWLSELEIEDYALECVLPEYRDRQKIRSYALSYIKDYVSKLSDEASRFLMDKIPLETNEIINILEGRIDPPRKFIYRMSFMLGIYSQKILPLYEGQTLTDKINEAYRNITGGERLKPNEETPDVSALVVLVPLLEMLH